MNRYTATTELRGAIRDQGRTFRWVADQLGMSDSHFNRILSGERWIAYEQADKAATILNTPFFLIWKVSASTEKVEAA